MATEETYLGDGLYAEGPEQHAIELALAGVLEQGGEALALMRTFAAAHAVDVLADDFVAGIGAPRAQLAKLIFRVWASSKARPRPNVARQSLTGGIPMAEPRILAWGHCSECDLRLWLQERTSAGFEEHYEAMPKCLHTQGSDVMSCPSFQRAMSALRLAARR